MSRENAVKLMFHNPDHHDAEWLDKNWSALHTWGPDRHSAGLI